MPNPRDSLPAVTPAFDPETPAGIGGWLLLMLLGLVLTPLRVASASPSLPCLGLRRFTASCPVWLK